MTKIYNTLANNILTSILKKIIKDEGFINGIDINVTVEQVGTEAQVTVRLGDYITSTMLDFRAIAKYSGKGKNQVWRLAHKLLSELQQIEEEEVIEAPVTDTTEVIVVSQEEYNSVSEWNEKRESIEDSGKSYIEQLEDLAEAAKGLSVKCPSELPIKPEITDPLNKEQLMSYITYYRETGLSRQDACLELRRVIFDRADELGLPLASKIRVATLVKAIEQEYLGEVDDSESVFTNDTTVIPTASTQAPVTTKTTSLKSEPLNTDNFCEYVRKTWNLRTEVDLGSKTLTVNTANPSLISKMNSWVEDDGWSVVSGN